MLVTEGLYYNYYASHIYGYDEIPDHALESLKSVKAEIISNFSSFVLSQKAFESYNTKPTHQLYQDIADEIERLLSNRMLESISNIQATKELPTMTLANSISAANAMINEGLAEAKTLSQIVKKMQSTLQKIFGTKISTLGRKYAATIIQETANNLKISYGVVASAIRNMFVQEYDNRFFKLNIQGDPSQELLRIYYEMLMLLETVEYGMYGEGLPPATQSAFARIVGQKISSYFQALFGITQKVAAGQGYLTAIQQFKDSYKGPHKKITAPFSVGGPNLYITKTVNNDNIQEALDKVNNITDKTTGAGLVSLSLGKNMVIGSVNFDVNDKRTYTPSLYNFVTPINVSNIKQKSQSMLAALNQYEVARNAMEDILLIAGAHGNSADPDSAKPIFDELFNLAFYNNYLTTVNELFTMLVGKNYYMDNGQVYLSSELLTQIQIGIIERMASNTINMSKRPTMPDNFDEMNSWEPPKRHNIESAIMRSSTYHEQGMAIFQEIRVEAKVSLMELVMLFRTI